MPCKKFFVKVLKEEIITKRKNELITTKAKMELWIKLLNIYLVLRCIFSSFAVYIKYDKFYR